MRYAIISDIHSNIQALHEVLEAISRLGVDAVVCLGDIVGYGARPSECISLVRDRCSIVLLGNHDAATAERTPYDNFNSLARTAIDWTRNALSPAEMEYLRGLPLTGVQDEFTMTHATYSSPEGWGYLFSTSNAAAEFDACDVTFLLYGHTHHPVVFALKDGEVRSHHVGRFSIDTACRHIINVGSVGQPRDGNPDSCFMTYDADKREIEYHRIPYDIEAAQKDILEAGIPKELAMRLSVGK